MSERSPHPLSPGSPTGPPLDPTATPAPAVPLARISLAAPATSPHRLDGAWWPRSHDLGRELPSLLAALEHRWPHISRITVSRSLWRTGPSRLMLGERVLRINRSDAAHSMILLVARGIGRCDLLVIPPGTSAHEGRRLLAAASTADTGALAASASVLDGSVLDASVLDASVRDVIPDAVREPAPDAVSIEPGRPEGSPAP